MIRVALCLSLALFTHQVHSEEGTTRFLDRSSVAIGIGNFDVDTDEPDDPHLNEVSYSILFGLDINRYIAVDLEAMHIEKNGGFDDFGQFTSFGAQALALSTRIQWPLADDFTAYLRTGGASMVLEENSVLRDEALDSNVSQWLYGGGIRGEHWFVEYVNYGKIEDLYLEQIRAGFVFRF